MSDDLATAALLFRSRLRGLLVAEAYSPKDASLLAGRPQAIDPSDLQAAERLPAGALMLAGSTIPQDDPGARPGPPMEWRLYARSSVEPRRDDGQGRENEAPFSLDGVLPAAAPPEELVAGAFRLVLQREPDPGGLDHHLRALRTGQPAATMMRSLLGSREALDRGEQLLLVLTAVPPPA